MKYAVQKISREFRIDDRSPLYVDIIAACKQKRKCVNPSCKKRLKLVDYLEVNVDGEHFESPSLFYDSMERLMRLWNDPRVELYCCDCFEAPAKIDGASAGSLKDRGERRPRSKIKAMLMAFLLYGLGWIVMGLTIFNSHFLPVIIAGGIIGGIMCLIGTFLFFREGP